MALAFVHLAIVDGRSFDGARRLTSESHENRSLYVIILDGCLDVDHIALDDIIDTHESLREQRERFEVEQE